METFFPANLTSRVHVGEEIRDLSHLKLAMSVGSKRLVAVVVGQRSPIHVVALLFGPPSFCSIAYQKQLRCDVVGEPGQTHAPCSRCKKHGLQCKIDANFKRVKKRGSVAP